MSVVSLNLAPVPLSRWARLRARFDDSLMRPPLPLAGPLLGWPAEMQFPWLAWCRQADAVAVAAVLGGEDVEARLDTALQVLDGSVALAACHGRLAGWRYRLALKVREFLQRQPHPDDPWDAGWLQPGAAALARLAVFQPRRHTLVVVQATQVAEVLAWLGDRRPSVAAVAGGSLRLRLLLVWPPGSPTPPRLEASLQSQSWASVSRGLWLE
jgi:hypothetical protein